MMGAYRSAECGQYAFGEFRLDVRDRSLTRCGHRVHLPPKTFAVLVALAERPDRLVTKRELLDEVWEDTFVEEGILTVYVAQLRKVLGDVKGSPRYIGTVSRAGYRFVAEVRQVERPRPGADSIVSSGKR
jgi:DNA-binding winged helix-turn-helix (wHTH) protein